MKDYLYCSWRVIFTHIKIMILSLIPGSVMFSGEIFSERVGFWYSVLFAGVYVMLIYSETYRIGELNAKTVSKQKPYAAKGFLISVPLVVISVVLTLIWHFSWMNAPDSKAVGTYIFRFIYMAWDFAFFGFAGMDRGYVSIIGYAVVLILPFISSGVGYLTGIHDFPIGIKLKQLMYKKK